MLVTVELSHSLWPAALRRVRSAIDCVLMVDGTPVTFIADPALSIPTLAKDGSGRVEAPIQLGNEDHELSPLFDMLYGQTERPVAIPRWYVDDVLDLQATLDLHEPRESGAAILAELRSENDDDVPAQQLAYSVENLPTIRGLR